MGTESNKAIVARYFAAWNSGNSAEINDLLAPHYIDHAHPEVKTAEAVKAAIQRTRASDPNFQIAIEFSIAEGDRVALRGMIQRTSQGQPIVSYVLWVARLENNRMVELWTGTETAH
jgi:predicted ester cyclase